MKISSSVLKAAMVAVLALSLGATPGCSKKSGGDATEGASTEGGTATATQLEAAYAALKAGNIPEAKQLYDAIVAGGSEANKTILKEAEACDVSAGQAAFGAAFTRMIQLYESPSLKAIAAMFNQVEPKVATLLGPGGWLTTWSEMNATDATIQITGATPPLDTAGPFFGRVSKNSYSFGISTTCLFEGVEIGAKNEQQDVDVSITLAQKLSDTSVSPAVVKHEILAGDIIPVTTMIECAGTQFPLARVTINHRNGNFKFMNTPVVGTSGNLKVNELSTSSGTQTTIEFDNIVLPNNSTYTIVPTLTLNGSITDVLSAPNKKADEVIPFHNLEVKNPLTVAQSGKTIADFQAQIRLLIPALEEIDALLGSASACPDVQFIIPKELYAGLHDLPINQTDVHALRAGVNFLMAGIYFTNSWSFPMQLAGIFGPDGHLLISKTEMVNILNQFFALKPDHEIAAARTAFAAGLQEVLAMKDSLTTATADGVFDNDAETQALYAEVEGTAKILQQSMDAGSIAYTYVTPPININLQQFFAAPPDGSAVSLGDPFVLDGNRIKPVESYFSNLMSGIVGIDFNQHYKHLYTTMKLGWHTLGFDEFDHIVVAGFLSDSF